MPEDYEYADYGLQMALTVIAMASTLLVDLSEPSTFVFALAIPILFGHTVHISRDKFSKASAASLIALVFTPLGFVTSLIALIIISLNHLISVFASGDSIRDFYGATSIPLIILGLLMGATLTGSMIVDPQIENQVEQEFTDFMVWKTNIMVQESGVLNQQELEQQSINELQQSMVVSLQGEVTASYDDKGGRDFDILQQAFEQASDDIQQNINNETSEESDQTEKIEEQVESMTDNMISGRMIYIITPILLLGLYAFQPVLGILTAILAKLFERLYRVIS